MNEIRTDRCIGRVWVPVMCVAGLLAGLAPTARGLDRCDRGEVDIERLKARMSYDYGQWRLAIRYKVELEDLPPGRFDLVVQPIECNGPVRDRRGRPIEFVVPLDRPSKVKRDEFEFKGRFSITLEDGTFANPRRVRLQAIVVDRYTHRVVAHDDTKIKVKRRQLCAIR